MKGSLVKKRKNLILHLAPLALAVFLTACDREPDAHPQPAPKSWNLPVMKAPAGVPVEYTAVGSVVSDQRVEVASRLSGYIREILVQEGDRVRRGQVLARLDAADVEGGIRQAQAGVGAAEAAFRDAQTDLERFQRLFERGSVSDNELRKIRLKHDAARETLNQGAGRFRYGPRPARLCRNQEPR
jgi:multidrug efflux pump subunit AcrA (membrane-fusion protein)